MTLSLRNIILLTSFWSLGAVLWVWEYYEGGLESFWHLMTIFSFSTGIFLYKDKVNSSFLYFFLGFVGAWLVSSLSLKLYNYGYVVFSGVELGYVSLIGYLSAGPFTPNLWLITMVVILFRVKRKGA